MGSILNILDLAALDIFPKDLISRLFSVQNHTLLNKFTEKYSPHALILIYNAIKTIYSTEYDGPMPPTSMVEDWTRQYLKTPKKYELRDALIAGIGGEKYVMSGLYYNGIHIGEHF